jgi:hypothetical protein
MLSMKRKNNDKGNRDVILSYRVTQEQKEMLMSMMTKMGFASLSQLFDCMLFSRKKNGPENYHTLINKMVLKGFNDLRYQLVHLSRITPATSEYQDRFVEIQKVIHRIHGDLRR